MNKLLLKIRHKLIRLLGGYTTQYAVPDNRYYIQRDLRPVTLSAETYFSPDMLSVPDFHKKMMENVAYQIGERLLEDGLILFSSHEPAYNPYQSVLRGVVKVLDPHQWVMFDGRADNG